MAKAAKRSDKKTASATTGYEAELWQMADALRGSMDAAEHKHVVLGLIFLKYISDAFEEHHAELDAQRSAGADLEDPDEYRAHNIFWVPPEARWSHLKGAAKQPTIGQLVDDAMTGIERDNPSLKGVLPNLAVELLQKLLQGEIKSRYRRRSYRARSLRICWNRRCGGIRTGRSTAQAIEELIGLARICGPQRPEASRSTSRTTSWPSTTRWRRTTAR